MVETLLALSLATEFMAWSRLLGLREAAEAEPPEAACGLRCRRLAAGLRQGVALRSMLLLVFLMALFNSRNS